MTPAISASLLRVRLRAPFFATLALHAQFIERKDIPTAATDGCDVFYNAEFLAALSPQHLDGVLLHEVLHAALGHVHRRHGRDPRRWNIAADVVVNGLIEANGFELPENAVRNGALCDYSVEEVYALLSTNDHDDSQDVDEDLLDGDPTGDEGDGGDNDAQQGDGAAPPKSTAGKSKPRHGLSEARRQAIEKHWKSAIAQAVAVSRSTKNGSLPGGVERAFALGDEPKLDWRSVLWRFLTPTTSDFAAFDRRFVHDGLYLETLEDEELHVAVCIDTSGSIDDVLVKQLIAEVEAVLAAYPRMRCALYYADAACHGPWLLTGRGDPIPPPVGGGGTDFRPFFDAVADPENAPEPSVCVYLTDGYGEFPDDPPPVETLWAVTPGGRADDQFPFGEVVRLDL